MKDFLKKSTKKIVVWVLNCTGYGDWLFDSISYNGLGEKYIATLKLVMFALQESIENF